MKTYSFNAYLLITMSSIIFMLSSCTKETVSTPPSQQSSTSDDALLPGETVTAMPTSATIFVKRFIDDAVDETSEFNGYSCEVQIDGDFIATTKTGETFTGKWRYDAETNRVIITITGTPALDDLSGNWKVKLVTDQRIVLARPGPDKLVFGVSEIN